MKVLYSPGPAPRPKVRVAGSQDHLPLGFPGSDVERRARWAQILGEDIHPHLQLSLSHSKRKREIKLPIGGRDYSFHSCFLGETLSLGLLTY